MVMMHAPLKIGGVRAKFLRYPLLVGNVVLQTLLDELFSAHNKT